MATTSSSLSVPDQSDSSTLTPSELTPGRGIPPALFIEDVPSFLARQHLTTPDKVEMYLKQLHEMYGKYKFMESQLVTQQKVMLDKIPEIEHALEAMQFIISHRHQQLETKFELADSVYAFAKIDAREKDEDCKVALWLGANVMLEFSYDEALQLLNTNLNNARVSLQSLEQDLSFLKDQITISEVNIARIHNVNVTLKKQLKDAQSQISASNSSKETGP